MKYAIISDVHGNYPALAAVLKDAEQAKVDKYIFVGDYATDMPYPNEVVEAIKICKNSYVIHGNGEDYFSNISTQDESMWTDGQFSVLYWSYKTLSKENRDYLMHLPQQINFSEGNRNVYVAHSSADFIGKAEHKEFSSSKVAMKYSSKQFSRDILLNDIHRYLSSDNEFQEHLDAMSDGIYIFGHTHIQWHVQFKNKIFINAGSCGEALDFSVMGAPYTILKVEADSIKVDERHVYYDRNALITAFKASSLYSQANVWSNLVISHVITGKEHLRFFLNYLEQYANEIGDKSRPYSIQT
jgi:predicted phosphodiesterase